MNIVKGDPFRELEGTQALNRRFCDLSFRGIDDGDLSVGDWAPAVDIQATDTEYIVKADLPEVKNLKVAVDDGVLTIAGERKQEKEENNKTFYRIERGYGTFVRRFALGTEVDATRLLAEFKDGVLNVHLPKSPRRQTEENQR